MRSSSASTELSKVLEQLNLLQDYIQLKFGIDFTVFLNSRKNETKNPIQGDVDLCAACRSRYKGQSEEDQGKSTRPCTTKVYETRAKNDESVPVERPERRCLRSSTMGAGSSTPVKTRKSEHRQNGDPVTTVSGDESDSVFVMKEEAISDDEDSMDFSNSQFLDPEFLPFDDDGESSGNEDDVSKTGENETSDDALRKTRRMLDWEVVAEYATYDEAKAYIKSLDEFRYHQMSKNKEDTTYQYICKMGRRCRARVRVKVPIIDVGDGPPKAILERTEDEHTHEPKPQWGIPEAVKTEIVRLFDAGLHKPKNILKALSKQGLPSLPKVQLNNFMVRLRIEKGLRQKRLVGNKDYKGRGRPRKVVGPQLKLQGSNPNPSSSASSRESEISASLLPELPPPPASSFDMRDEYI